MKRWLTIGASLAALSAASPAFAQDGWFVEGSAAGGWLDGSSDTRNGGAASGGGGTVVRIDVADGMLLSAGFGRGVSEHWSLGVSYAHLTSDVSFRANYVLAPAFPSFFNGETSTDALLFNARYTTPFGGAGTPWRISGAAAIGAARNSLSDVTEDFSPPNGAIDRRIAEGESDQFAWQLSGRLSYALSSKISLFGEASYFDFGEFTTGDTRAAPTEAIGPYQLDITGATLGAGVRVAF